MTTSSRSDSRYQLLQQGDSLRLQQEWVAAEERYVAALAKARSTHAKASAYTRLASLFIDASRDGFLAERLERRPELLPAAAGTSRKERTRAVCRARPLTPNASRELPPTAATNDSSNCSPSSDFYSGGGSSSSFGHRSRSSSSSISSNTSNCSRKSNDDSVSDHSESRHTDSTSNSKMHDMRCSSSSRRDFSSNEGSSYRRHCGRSSSTCASPPEEILLGKAEAILLREARKFAAAALRLIPRRWHDAAVLSTAAARRLKGVSILYFRKPTNPVARSAPATAAVMAAGAAAAAARTAAYAAAPLQTAVAASRTSTQPPPPPPPATTAAAAAPTAGATVAARAAGKAAARGTEFSKKPWDGLPQRPEGLTLDICNASNRSSSLRGSSRSESSNINGRSTSSTVGARSSRLEHLVDMRVGGERLDAGIASSSRRSSSSSNSRRRVPAALLEQKIFCLDQRRRRQPLAVDEMCIAQAALLSSAPSGSGIATASPERQRQLLSHLLAALLPAAGDTKRTRQQEVVLNEAIHPSSKEKLHTQSHQQHLSAHTSCFPPDSPLLSAAAAVAPQADLIDSPTEATSHASRASPLAAVDAVPYCKKSNICSYKSEVLERRRVNASFSLSYQEHQYQRSSRDGCSSSSAIVSRRTLRGCALLRLLRQSRGLLHVYCELRLLQMKAFLFQRQLLMCMYTWKDLRETLATLMPLRCSSSSSKGNKSSTDNSSSSLFSRSTRTVGGGREENRPVSREKEMLQCRRNAIESSSDSKEEPAWDIELFRMHADLIGGAAGCELLQLFYRKHSLSSKTTQRSLSSVYIHPSSSPLSSLSSTPSPFSSPVASSVCLPSTCLPGAAVPPGASRSRSHSAVESQTASSSPPPRDAAAAAAASSPSTHSTSSAAETPALLFGLDWKMVEEVRVALVSEVLSLCGKEQQPSPCRSSSLLSASRPPVSSSGFTCPADTVQCPGVVSSTSSATSRLPVSAVSAAEVFACIQKPQQSRTTAAAAACASSASIDSSEVLVPGASAAEETCAPAASAALMEKGSSHSNQQHQQVGLHSKQALQLQQPQSLEKRQQAGHRMQQQLEEEVQVLDENLQQLLLPLLSNDGWLVGSVECPMLAAAVSLLQQHCLLAFRFVFACGVRRADWNMAASAAAWAARCLLHSGRWTEALIWSTQALQLDAWVSADALSPRRPRRLLLHGLSSLSPYEGEHQDKKLLFRLCPGVLHQQAAALATPLANNGGQGQALQEQLQKPCRIPFKTPCFQQSEAEGVRRAAAAARISQDQQPQQHLFSDTSSPTLPLAAAVEKASAAAEGRRRQPRQQCCPASESLLCETSTADAAHTLTAVPEERGMQQQQQDCSCVLQEKQQRPSADSSSRRVQQRPEVMQEEIATAAATPETLMQLPLQTSPGGTVEAQTQQMKCLPSSGSRSLSPCAKLQQQLQQQQQKRDHQHMWQPPKQHQQEHLDGQWTPLQTTFHTQQQELHERQEQRQCQQQQQQVKAEACSSGDRTTNALDFFLDEGKRQEDDQQEFLRTSTTVASGTASTSPATAAAADHFSFVSSPPDVDFSSCTSTSSSSASLNRPSPSAPTCCYTAVPLLPLLTLYSPFYVRSFALLMEGRLEEAAATLRLATLVSLYPSDTDQQRHQQKQQKKQQQNKRQQHVHRQDGHQQQRQRSENKPQQRKHQQQQQLQGRVHKEAEEEERINQSRTYPNGDGTARDGTGNKRTGVTRACEPEHIVESIILPGGKESRNSSSMNTTIGRTTEYVSSSHTCTGASVCCNVSSELSTSVVSSCSVPTGATTHNQSSRTRRSDTTPSNSSASSNTADDGTILSGDSSNSADISNSSNSIPSGSDLSISCSSSGNSGTAAGTIATATTEKKRRLINPRQPLRRWERTAAEMERLRIKRDRLKIPSF